MAILSKYFSEPDLKEIKLAVKDAELKTSAEIVPYFAEASHDYGEAKWLISFATGALFGSVLLGVEFWDSNTWGYDSKMGVFVVWIGALVGFLLGLLFPKLRLWFTPKKSKFKYVWSQAREAFLKEEVFGTTDRIGILIYVSFREKVTVVLPDKGIAKVVPEAEWQKAVDLIVNGMKSKDKKQGLVQAIWFCGDLLEKYGIRVKKENRNEIADDLREGGVSLS